MLCNKLIDARLKIVAKTFPEIPIQSTNFSHTEFLTYSPYCTLFIHHTSNNHFLLSTNFFGDIYIYDSLNLPVSQELIAQITMLYSPQTNIPTVQQVHITKSQVGSYDCDLFALAYASELDIENALEKFLFDQSKMRAHLTFCLEKNEFVPLPKIKVFQMSTNTTEVTHFLSPTQEMNYHKKDD
uniref:Ubiquitin-like protease family profile domain-containing protein n=1 Tax=Octopus bimaculoides TaxID=37653 RepID=A0A0L8FR10_OCTBM